MQRFSYDYLPLDQLSWIKAMIYFSREEVERIGKAGACQHPSGAWRYLSSFWLYVEDQDKAFTPHVRTGYWEAWITAWLSQQFDKHNIFVDVGANIGYYTMMAATHGLPTIAVEPNPDVASLLRKSAKLNHVQSKVQVWMEALGDTNEMGTLTVPPGHSGGAFLSNGLGIPVHIAPLDTRYHFGHTKRVLMKIDAEGAEPKIWNGMGETLATTKMTIFLEWEKTRYDALAFAQDLFDQASVAVIEFDGTERRLDNIKDLLVLEGLQTVVVRTWSW